MDKGFLIEILQMYKDGDQSLEAVLTAVDEYSSASNNGKPIVSGSLPCRFCDVEFTDEYDLEAHVQFNHNQFSGNDR